MARPHAYPLLSFLELERYIALGADLTGMRVEKVFIPETVAHPDRYFKKEWALELHSPHQSAQLYFSVRSHQAGLVFLPTKTLKPAKTATRSGFDLSLAKKIEGQRIEKISTVPTERVVRIRFSNALELVLVLIPAGPEVVLFENGEVIASTKTRNDGQPAFALPTPRTLTDEQMKKIPLRPEWCDSRDTYFRVWFEAQAAAALLLRRQRIEAVLKTQNDSFQRKRKSLQQQLSQSQQEPNWESFGTLLQTHFYAKPVPQNGFYELMDYEKDETIRIPADPKLGLKQQLERYFHLAKRNRTRLIETDSRIQALLEKEAVVNQQLETLANATALNDLESIESKMGIGHAAPLVRSKEQKKLAEFSGKQYQSKEGLTILVGRNLTENLELTFKIARGNDLWLHVKGRTGSHVVVLLPQKRTASLDTLLDAAQLCVLHSGGKDWGKTDVDYTQRKHVKKIKNQTEVSYTHNKTLVVTVEEDRVKRLYESE